MLSLKYNSSVFVPPLNGIIIMQLSQDTSNHVHARQMDYKHQIVFKRNLLVWFMPYLQRSKTSDAPFRRETDPRSLPQQTQGRRGKARAPVNPDLGREPGLELVRERPDDTLSPGHPQVLETPESLSDSLYDSLSSCGSQGWERAPVAEWMGTYWPSGTDFFTPFTVVTSGSIFLLLFFKWTLTHETARFWHRRTLTTCSFKKSPFYQEFLLDESQRRSVGRVHGGYEGVTEFLGLCHVFITVVHHIQE